MTAAGHPAGVQLPALTTPGRDTTTSTARLAAHTPGNPLPANTTPTPTTPPRTRPWPFTQDTAVDRARTIGMELLRALRRHAPEEAAQLEQSAREFGEGWVSGQPDWTPEGLISAEELAKRMGVRPSTVRDWTSRGMGPGAREGRGRRLTHYPGGYDPVEAAELRAWARRGDTDDDGTGPSC